LDSLDYANAESAGAEDGEGDAAMQQAEDEKADGDSWSRSSYSSSSYSSSSSSSSVRPDVSSYEYVVKNLCQALRVKEAWQMLQQMKQQGLTNAPAYAALATADALLADLKGE